jgi:ATP-dependent DNA helicase RecG
MTQRGVIDLVVEQGTLVSEWMINQLRRVCFHPLESESAIVSQVIAATIGAGLIKTDEKVGGSRKFVRYLPFWT